MAAKDMEIEAEESVALEEFAASALFDRSFYEAMSLVEECARYLDWRGCEVADAAEEGRAGLCGREHAHNDTPDAGGILVARSARGS